MKTKLLFILVAMTALAGCDRTYYYKVDSYIQVYYEIDRLRVDDMVYGHDFRICAGGDDYVSFKSTGEQKKEYERQCEKNGDTGYNREIDLIADQYDVACGYPDMTSIVVTSDKDFDAEHPAGASLNDCVTVTYESAYGYIRSGYNKEYLLFNRDDTDNRDLKPVTKVLSDVVPEDLKLLVSEIAMDFVKVPDDLSEHEITVSVVLEGGKRLEASMSFDFSAKEDTKCWEYHLNCS